MDVTVMIKSKTMRFAEIVIVETLGVCFAYNMSNNQSRTFGIG